MSKRISPGWRIASLSALFISQLILLIGSVNLVTAASSQQRRFSQPELGLEIILPDSWRSPLKVVNGGRSMSLIKRQELTINDPNLAADFTAVDVWADGEDNAIRVRLSVIYNDLSNQEWWKDKKEKVAGSLLIREGESARLTALAQFGIEPFEMRAITTKPVVSQPGEVPRIVNNTKSLEVVRLEKSLDRYQMWLKNNSSKNVVAYTISTGNESLSTSGVGYGNIRPAIAAGATSDEINLHVVKVIAAGAASDERHLYGAKVEEDRITIPIVVFEDGSFEGDIKLAVRFLVNGEGIRIQAPHVLRMVEQTLQVEDAELQTAFDKLEAQLWVIPEAIDKQSAVELLKSKYPSFDDETISGLYEQLKGGLYQARNMALSPIGDIKRRIQEDEQRQESKPAATRASLLRATLTQIKNDFERIVGSNR